MTLVLERVVGNYEVVVRDGDQVHVLRGPQQPLLATPGPGMLKWTKIEDQGHAGIAAPWVGGRYVILRVAHTCCLFFERTEGGFDTIALGEPEALKQKAWSRRCLSDFFQLIREGRP